MTSTTTSTTVETPGAVTGLFSSADVRIEGRDKVSGKMQYTADQSRPDMLWAAFTTSPYAHARIVHIDTSAAKAVPGVKAVLTSADLPPGKRSGRMLYDYPVLAYDKVLFIGDRVAAIAAETPEAAEAAARLVEVEYDELPAVFDAVAALEPDAPVLHPDRDSYFFAAKEPPPRPHPNTQGSARIVKGSDPDPVFARAPHVFEHTFTTPRQHAGYIEPHATFVWIDADDVVHVYTPNKQPFSVHRWLSNVIDVPMEKIVVEPCAIGGDFGGKGLTIDEFVCYYLAKATGRPVKYVWTYLDELQSSSTRHAAQVTLKTAVDANGKFLAHRSNVIYNGGAYAAGKPGPTLCPGMNGYSTVPYHIPDVVADMTTVYTNTIAGAHVRSPADVQVFFAWEQHVDIMARELGIDPIELRMLNVVRDGEPSVSNEDLYRPQGLAVLDALKRDFEARPLAPGTGRGCALVCRHTGGGKTAIDATVFADGTISIVCGVPDQGSGIFTAVRRIVAETLGIDGARIAVRRGSTRDAKTDPGSGGSRVTHIVGQAAIVACDAIVAELKHRTGITVDDDASFARAAAEAAAGGPFTVTGEFDSGTHDAAHPADFSFTAFGFDVAVDRETGAYRIDDAVIVCDVGRIINPVGHQGQLEGGFVYGFGSATMEEMPVDEGGKVTTLSLGEYKMPTVRDLPPLRTILVESPAQGPYGAKMAGELTNSGVAPALANAVYDASGVRLTAFPITAERIYAALTSTSPATPVSRS